MIKSNSVVVVGDLNPAIFSPSWVRAHLDIVVDDGEEPEVQIIHPDIADFMISDLRFTVERNRLNVSSLVHDAELLVSVALQIFTSVLTHTPVWAFGVNFERHIDFETFEKRNALGRQLCPLEPWGKWAENLENKDPILNGGMSSVTMKKIVSREPERFEQLTIQPSNHPEMNQSGVFFQINNHYSFKQTRTAQDEGPRAQMFVAMRENVTGFVETFDELILHFMKLGGVHER